MQRGTNPRMPAQRLMCPRRRREGSNHAQTATDHMKNALADVRSIREREAGSKNDHLVSRLHHRIVFTHNQ